MAVEIDTAGEAVLLCDAAGEEPSALKAALGMATIRLDEAERGQLALYRTLVIDVDVHDVGKVRALRGILPESDAVTRIFVLRTQPPERAERVQAEALGADQLIAREKAMDQLLRDGIIPRLTTAPQGDESADPSIREAGATLANLFDGLLGDKLASIEDVARVGSAVLEGVAAAGNPTNWLEEVRAHHQGTFQHCLLVAGVSAAFAASARLGDAASTTLMSAAILHDIGKAGIPLHILDKPGRLDPAELKVMRRHPELGYEHLKRQSGISPQVLDAVLHHHELLDGSGYPHRLKGSQIRPLTRVLTVCDIFAALVELRAYKPPRSPEQAMAVLLDMAWAGQVEMELVKRLAVAMRVDLTGLSEGPGYRRH